jgi:hypothetical protein
MNPPEALLESLQVALVIFGLLMLLGVLSLKWRRHRGTGWHSWGPLLVRYAGIRAGFAVAIGVSYLAVLLAALALNTHRPPADTNPVVQTSGLSAPLTVKLTMDDCGDPVAGELIASGEVPANARATVYSDADGRNSLRFDRSGRANFTLSDPSAKRGLLSCFMQLPVVTGSGGPATVKLALGDRMQVDTTESAPSPNGFFGGSWLWRCPAGNTCPGLATIEYDIESGAKQVIVLVLAAIFGAMIALLVGEFLLSGIRARIDRYFSSRD